MALPCAGGSSKTPGPARPEDSTAVTPLLSGWHILRAPPPQVASSTGCAHIEHWGEGHIRLGCPAGPRTPFQDLELGLPKEAQPHPNCPRSGPSALAREPPLPEAEWRQSGPPEPLAPGTPLRQGVPSGTSLEVAGRHRQEAQREVGWPGAALRLQVTPARTAVGKSRICGAAVTWGALVWGEAGVSVSLLPGVGTRLSGLGGVCGGDGRGEPLSLSFR